MTLVIGIDRVLNEMRAVVNLIGNCVATVAIGRWEKSIDLDRANKVLRGEIDVDHVLNDADARNELAASMVATEADPCK